MDATLKQIVEKSQAALKSGYGTLSTGERIAAALVLNRPDWLAELGYTLAEAIDRLGTAWISRIPVAAREIAAMKHAEDVRVSEA